MTPRREAVAAWRRELGGRALTALAQATPTWRFGPRWARLPWIPGRALGWRRHPLLVLTYFLLLNERMLCTLPLREMRDYLEFVLLLSLAGRITRSTKKRVASTF